MHESLPQFVLLRHTRTTDVHWDLGLDVGEVLVTWQIHENPERLMRSPAALPARRIHDHRRIYLEYEGAISGGRGHVTRVDRGSWQSLEQSATRWRIRLMGQILEGVFMLERSLEITEVWRIRRETQEGEDSAPKTR